jgi:hypothetical protein
MFQETQAKVDDLEEKLKELKKKWIATTGFELSTLDSKPSSTSAPAVGSISASTAPSPPNTAGPGNSTAPTNSPPLPTKEFPSNPGPGNHTAPSHALPPAAAVAAQMHDLERLQVSISCALAARGDLVALRKMLEAGADVLHRGLSEKKKNFSDLSFSVNYDRCTVLNTAVKFNQKQVVEFLIGQGASLGTDIDGKEVAKRTPMEDALKWGHGDVAMVIEEAMARQEKDMISKSLEFAAYIPATLEKKIGSQKKMMDELYPEPVVNFHRVNITKRNFYQFF